MLNRANNTSDFFCTFIFNRIHAFLKNCGGGDNSHSTKETRTFCKYLVKKYVTSTDVQGFSYCQLGETQSRKKTLKNQIKIIE